MSKKSLENITIKKNQLNVEEYLFFRKSVSWSLVEKTVVEKSLKNELFSVCIYKGNNPIAMGRVIGDGAIYFYIQDIIVLPQYHKMGYGNLVMKQIEEFLTLTTSLNSFIGLIAADGVQGFYEKFGYTPRQINAPGMYRIIK